MSSIELRPVEYYGGKAYEVLRDGEPVGIVRYCFPSFDRGPRQATYVTKRWKARRPYWEWALAGKHNASGLFCETRKQAVERLLRDKDRP